MQLQFIVEIFLLSISKLYLRV